MTLAVTMVVTLVVTVFVVIAVAMGKSGWWRAQCLLSVRRKRRRDFGALVPGGSFEKASDAGRRRALCGLRGPWSVEKRIVRSDTTGTTQQPWRRPRRERPPITATAS